MFIVFGIKNFTKDLGAGDAQECVVCRLQVCPRVISRRSWISLFFIPIIPLLEEQVTVCPRCGNEEGFFNY